MNLASLIRTQAVSRPHKTAIEYAGQTIDYADMHAQITALALMLREAGVATGDRVGLCLRDHPVHVASHFAVAGIGAIVVPLDHRWSLAERQAATAAFNVKHVLIDDDADPPAGVAHSLVPAVMPAADSGGEILFAPSDEMDWLISLSSGSTGRPTGALVTHRQMYERFVTQWVSLGFNCSDRFALVTPLHFGAGRSFAMSFLAAGATLVIVPPPLPPEEMANAVVESRATATFLVPTLMRRLLSIGDGSPLFPGLRRLLISGEACFADEIGEFQRRLTSNLIGYYASSEGGGISVLQPDEFSTHGASVGQAAFGVEVQIVDEHDNQVVTGEVGRVRYRGPGVTTRAIDENGRLDNAATKDGWFCPGDLASLDSSGYITLSGRSKDVIVRAGVNIYPGQIESVLRGVTGVREVAVIGCASPSRGEEIVAFVCGAGLDPARLDAYCRANLAPYKVPSQFVIQDTLPKTRAGKVDKVALREGRAAGD